MIICSSLCMPKDKYHIGNAISAIYSELIAKHYYYQKGETAILLSSPWNLHGIPYERLFLEENRVNGTYNDILLFAKGKIEYARKELSSFASNKWTENLCDTDEDFVQYTVETFLRLVELGFIIKIDKNWVIDTKKIISMYDISDLLQPMKTIPSNEKRTIISQSNTFDGFYPISKDRVFTVKCCYKNEEICINPIFQSFIMANFLSEKYGSSKVSHFVCGSGFSSHKWHYYRQLISAALTGDTSIERIVFHGIVLGDDNRPMSKHSDNCISPRSLFELIDDRMFVRYFLIRCISNNDKQINTNMLIDEYKRISSKLELLENDTICLVENKNEEFLDEVEMHMKDYKFGIALEMFSVYLRKTAFVSAREIGYSWRRIKRIYNIFF